MLRNLGDSRALRFLCYSSFLKSRSWSFILFDFSSQWYKNGWNQASTWLVLLCSVCPFHLATSLFSFFWWYLPTIFCFKILEHVLFQCVSFLMRTSAQDFCMDIHWSSSVSFWDTVLESSQQQIENAIQSISAHGFLSNYGASS